mmetsp:Transcript_22402/g.47082  ORF Transcript_22402/g.47082 Transcript_22402/m.47082 type:complete len:214 (+) Transcript_22402:906-1547(+)
MAVIQLVHVDECKGLVPGGDLLAVGAELLPNLLRRQPHHIRVVLSAVQVIEAQLNHALAKLIHGRVARGAHQNSRLWVDALQRLLLIFEVGLHEAVVQGADLLLGQAAGRTGQRAQLELLHHLGDRLVVPLEADAVDEIEDGPNGVCLPCSRRAVHQREGVALARVRGGRVLRAGHVVSRRAHCLVLRLVEVLLEKLLLELLARALLRQLHRL